MPSTPRPVAIDDAIDIAADETKSFADRVTDTVSDGVSNAADFVADSVKSVTAQVPKVGEWLDHQLDWATTAAREKPIQTLAIVAGVSAVLGALFLRR